jgi:hypothetical protein
MTAIFTKAPVVGWIERQVRAPSDTAFYRIEGGAGRGDRAASWPHPASSPGGRLPMTEAVGTIKK